LFGHEQPKNIGLEEVVYNDDANEWEVTAGFSRPWDFQQSGIMAQFQPAAPKREYKVVTVDDASGQVKPL
jgi:hypothetical protein